MSNHFIEKQNSKLLFETLSTYTQSKGFELPYSFKKELSEIMLHVLDNSQKKPRNMSTRSYINELNKKVLDLAVPYIEEDFIPKKEVEQYHGSHNHFGKSVDKRPIPVLQENNDLENEYEMYMNKRDAPSGPQPKVKFNDDVDSNKLKDEDMKKLIEEQISKRYIETPKPSSPSNPEEIAFKHSYEASVSKPSIMETRIIDFHPQNKDVDPKLLYDNTQFRQPVAQPSLPPNIHQAQTQELGRQNLNHIPPADATNEFEIPPPFLSTIPRYSTNNISNTRHIPNVLIVDSRDRNDTAYPDQHNYRLNLKKIYKNIVSMELISAEVPRTGYIVNDNNNKIYFEETGGTTLTATIPPGNYDTSSLPAAIKSALEAVGGSTYTVTYNSTTNKITIASDGAGGAGIFNLLFDGGTENYDDSTKTIYLDDSAGPIIGFAKTDLSGSLTYTGQNVINLNGECYIFMIIKEFRRIDSRNITVDNAFAKLVFDNGLNSFKFYEGEQARPIKYFSPPHGKLSHLSIEFRTYSGDYYNFNGVDHSLSFEIFSQEDEDVII